MQRCLITKPWCLLSVLFLLSLSIQVRQAYFLKRKFIGYCRIFNLLNRKLWLVIFRCVRRCLTNQTRGCIRNFLLSVTVEILSWRFRNLSSHFLNNVVYTGLKLIQFQFCVYAIKIGNNVKTWRLVSCCLVRIRIH